jgi:polar amino acid transport system substrate-binding protein
LIQYLEALKPAERWSHIPVASDEAALLDVTAGKLAAALVWGPSFWDLQKSNPDLAKLRIIAPKPLPAASADVGAVMLTRETYLRTNVDQAIAALTADGTIAAILKSFDFPAAPIK